MTRQEATRILDEVIPPPEHHTVDLDHLRIAQAWQCIKEELTAEQGKPGRWLIGVGENGEPIGTYCSECGWSWVNGVAAVNLNKALSLIKTPRCPWCGAKMDEVEDDD